MVGLGLGSGWTVVVGLGPLGVVGPRWAFSVALAGVGPRESGTILSDGFRTGPFFLEYG